MFKWIGKRNLREVTMHKLAEKTAKPEANDRDLKNENGLQNVVAHYQKLFDVKENVDHYNSSDYQNAKRSFVKYLLKNRAI